MITCLGMTLPMAVWSLFAWIRHPSADGKEVAIRKRSRKDVPAVAAGAVLTTAVLHLLLRRLCTPNLLFATISVTTRFIAAAFTLLRNSWYALGYAANDVVLILLWGLASLENPAYVPVILNFALFLVNDLYGFISWRRRERHPGKDSGTGDA